jgi:shikimate dehydrogenase
MQKLIGLIGFPLKHSFSKGYFTDKFNKDEIKDYRYENFEFSDLNGLLEFIEKTPELIGFNVTIPHKISIQKYLTEIDDKAKFIGSINTVKIIRENTLQLIGYNTDVLGLMMALKPQLRPTHQRALILGNGGSSKAAQYVLKNLGIDFLIVTRTPKKSNEISYSQLNENHIRFHHLIIQTTPLGMWPNVEKYPELNYEAINENHLLFDLIYNPEMTEFLKKGKEKGAMISNGLSMLHQQAEASWKIWNGINT